MIHKCPRKGCEVKVPDHLFACRPDWFALSYGTRRAIWATAGLHPTEPSRYRAIMAAIAEWEALGGGR